MITLNAEASAISTRIRARGYSFDPMTIVTIALALWNQCFNKQNPTVSAADKLRAHWDGEKFDDDLLDQARHNAKKANRIAFRRGKSDERHRSNEELDVISTEAFRHIMDADDEVLAACARECSEMTFDDDDDAE